MLNVNEVLTQKEQDMISEWIACYGGLYSGVKCSPAPLDHVLRYWAENKEVFYHMFGDQLSIAKRINYEAPLCDLRAAMDREMTGDMYDFFSKLSEIMRYQDNVVGTAIDNADLPPYLFGSSNLREMLIKNRWELKDVKIPLENGKFFTIKTGMRVTRAFQKIAEIVGIPGFEVIRELHAKISTAKVLQGTMHLTIHPLDFITMSDNEEGWDSCMNWRNQGDYRAGTVEMLNSPVVIEAYIESGKYKMQFSEYEWNSKIWRELYIVTPNMISNIRAYPFIDGNLSDIAIRWIRELAMKAGYSDYRDVIDIYGDNDESTNYVNDNSIELRMSTDNMYNDYCREPQHIIFRHGFGAEWKGQIFKLNYSGPMVCMNCGDLMNRGLEETRAVMCGACSDDQDQTWVCDYCGNTVYDEDDIYIVDDTYLCRDCFEDPDTTCVAYDDQESHLVNNCTQVYLGNPEAGNYIYIYDRHWWVRHNNEGITADHIKYVNTRPRAPYMKEAYMIPLEHVTQDMVRELGFYSMDEFKAMYEDYNDNEYEELEFPAWRWGA